MRKILILSLLIISLLVVFVIPVSASAAIFDPYENGTVTVDGDNEVVTILNDYSSWYWRARFDNASTNIASSTGQTISYSVTMAELDNTIVEAFPFGYQGMTTSDGIPVGSRIEGDFDFSGSVINASQSYAVRATLYLKTYDSNGSLLSSVVLESETFTGLTDSFTFGFRPSFDASALAGSDYWSFVLGLDFSDVANESDTVKINVGVGSGHFLISIPYSQLYQLKAQGAKTNKLLDQIDKQMLANGEKLDDVIAGQDGIRDDLDNIANGTVPPNTPDGQDKIDDLDNQEGQLRDDAADGLQQGLDMMDDTLDALFTYSFGFFALGLVFELFFQIPFFNVLVSLSLVLGILASFLGIIVSISSAGGGRYSKAKSQHQRSPKSNQPKQGGKV